MPCTWSPRLTQGGGRLRHLVISRTHTGGIMDHDGMIQNNSHKLCIIWDAVRAANVSRKVNRLFLSTKWMFHTRSIHFSWHIIEVAAGANFCRTCRKEHFQLQENNLQRLGRLADLYVARLIASPCPFSPPTFAPSFYRFLHTDSYIHILIYRFLLLADSYSIFMPSPWAISAISERLTLHIGSLMLSLPGSAQRNICRLMKGPSLPELGKPRELAATSWDSREGCETMQSSAFTAFTLGSLLSMFHPTSSGWNWRTLFELQGVHNRNFPAAGGNTNNSSCKDSWRTHNVVRNKCLSLKNAVPSLPVRCTTGPQCDPQLFGPISAPSSSHSKVVEQQLSQFPRSTLDVEALMELWLEDHPFTMTLFVNPFHWIMACLVRLFFAEPLPFERRKLSVNPLPLNRVIWF